MSKPFSRISRVVVIAAIAVVCGPVALVQSAGAVVGIAATTFSDEFNGAAGTAVDTRKWNMEVGDNVNNHERQYYTNRTANASMNGQGQLVITARRENPGNYNCWYGRCTHTSARLNTSGKFSQTYGTFEARIKMSHGQGMWPAFWLLGNDIGQVGWPQCGEIDVMENIGREPNTVHGTIHGPGYSGSGGIGAAYNGPASPTASTRSAWNGHRTCWCGRSTAASTSAVPRPTSADGSGCSTSRTSSSSTWRSAATGPVTRTAARLSRTPSRRITCE
jgi:beta-glucanase (GH16 family)